MRKQIALLSLVSLVILLSLVMVSAEPSYIFKKGEDVNYRFRCFDVNNNYCSAATILTISIENPVDGSNAVDNLSMTYNPTHFNVSLPTTTLGDYEAIIVSPTTNGTISEFTYKVTYTGEQVSLSNAVVVLAFLILAIICLVLGFTFKTDYWLLKTFFFFCSVLSGILAINSGRIIASESMGLSRMSDMGLLIGIVIFAIFFIFMFVFAFIEIMKIMKNRKELRWDY